MLLFDDIVMRKIGRWILNIFAGISYDQIYYLIYTILMKYVKVFFLCLVVCCAYLSHCVFYLIYRIGLVLGLLKLVRES